MCVEMVFVKSTVCCVGEVELIASHSGEMNCTVHTKTIKDIHIKLPNTYLHCVYSVQIENRKGKEEEEEMQTGGCGVFTQCELIIHICMHEHDTDDKVSMNFSHIFYFFCFLSSFFSFFITSINLLFMLIFSQFDDLNNGLNILIFHGDLEQWHHFCSIFSN